MVNLDESIEKEIGAGCLYAAKIQESNYAQISPESQVLQSGPSGGFGGGLGSEKPASALGSGLGEDLDGGLGSEKPASPLGSGIGGGLGGGLGSSNPDPQFDDYINWNDFLNPNDGYPWDHYDHLQ